MVVLASMPSSIALFGIVAQRRLAVCWDVVLNRRAPEAS
jgi:hypothetical protein